MPIASSSTDGSKSTGTTNDCEKSAKPHSHAYHHNLPRHYIDSDGIPLVTKYADQKARAVIKLVHSIQLTEDSFISNSEDELSSSAEEDDHDISGIFQKKNTMASIVQRCGRINSILSTLDTLKHCGIMQDEFCNILLHVLHLLSATVTFSGEENDDAESNETKKIVIGFDNVGYLYNVNTRQPSSEKLEAAEQDRNGKSTMKGDDTTAAIKHKKELAKEFALPSPARESLLTVALNLLLNKNILRSVSNTSVTKFSEDNEINANDSFLLIINWKALLRMLLRTAPYLDELKTGLPPFDSNSRQSSVLKRTVNLICDLRRFYDQGLEIKDNIVADNTAQEVWDMVKLDLVRHTHSNACFRSAILLYLFHPSRCSSEFYRKVIPQWMESWTSIDRCADFDFMFLTMFCRARKYLEPDAFHWGPLRRRILTICGYWLQVPIGGNSSDKSFPRAGMPKSRALPARLKIFLGTGSSYQEGINFVRKMAKLLVFCIGKNDYAEPNSTTDIKPKVKDAPVSDGTEDILRFFSFVAPYFNPSNTGSWTLPLGILLHYISYSFCERLGLTASQITLSQTHRALSDHMLEVEPYKKSFEMEGNEIVIILDTLLPLCQQALYSKNSHVCRAGESSLVYLAQIDPVRVCPAFLDSAIVALDICSVTLSHQAPAALSALNRLVVPTLRRNPAMFLERLPAILGLSLAGIDSNDQNKTLRTLALYRNITSWIPIGSLKVVNFYQPPWIIKNNGTWRFSDDFVNNLSSFCKSDKYISALSQVAESSLLYLPQGLQPKEEDNQEDSVIMNLVEEAALCMSEWSLAFLERIFGILRATGEQEKIGKSHGLASRHSSADASRTRNFSRVMKECLMQVFAVMDSKTFDSALRSVVAFLEGETLHMAAKDASALCEAIAAVRTDDDDSNCNPGLNVIVPLLTKDLCNHSKNAIIYRLRCIAGAVRQSGKALLSHKDAIYSAVKFALTDTKDKHIFKAGCKLLRHTLASQCESYIITTDNCPRITAQDRLGKSAHLSGDNVQWHIPSGAQINFVADMLRDLVLKHLYMISTKSMDTVNKKVEGDTTKQANLLEWRQCLKMLRYTLRGSSGILLDYDNNENANADSNTCFLPQELAVRSLLLSSSEESRDIIFLTRGKLTTFISSMLSLIARGSANMVDKSADADPISLSSLIAADTKICKEVTEISLILLSRRGVSSGFHDTETIWKTQKQLLTNHPVDVQRREILSILQKAGMILPSIVVYKDGEEGGKSISRRLVTTRVNAFLTSIERQASFDIPRRLRRLRLCDSTATTKLFNLKTGIIDMHRIISALFAKDVIACPPLSSLNALDSYEGVIDGLFAMACHPNTEVRGTGIGASEYALTRFGWLVQDRAPRLLNAISLNDSHQDGIYGVPSCAKITSQLDSKERRMRLAEVLKGICSIIAIPRTMKAILATEENRFLLVKALCSTHHLISLLPSQEMQKMLYYFHSIFSQFRSKFFSRRQLIKRNREVHNECLSFLLSTLSTNIATSVEDSKGYQINALSDQSSAHNYKDPDVSTDVTSMHWRNRLIIGWFISTFVDSSDVSFRNGNSCQIWNTCFELICTEIGQPLQRVSIGLLGRLVALALNDNKNIQPVGIDKISLTTKYASLLLQKVQDDVFCRGLVNALVYDHKEDTSVGGGINPQWSFGVRDVLKDSTSNLAARILFPFQRVNRFSSTFKLQHAQLIHSMLLLVGQTGAIEGAKYLLPLSKELAMSPPSEDQRNQLCTSAEIFAGVCRVLLQVHCGDDELSTIWETVILCYLDDVIPKIPVSVMGAFFDALRYGIHHSTPRNFFILTKWAVRKIEDSILKQEDNLQHISNLTLFSEGKEESPSSSVDGFATQSTWLSLMSVILVEIDTKSYLNARQGQPFLCESLFNGILIDENTDLGRINEDLLQTWNLIITRLLPCVLNTLGHPYQKCRENIAECLFRVCYCYRKLSSKIGANSSNVSNEHPNFEKHSHLLEDPGLVIIDRLRKISESTELSTKTRHHSLITARKFIAYCVHWGDCKNEYSEFIIPLIPLVFDAVKSTMDETGVGISPADRMVQAEVAKGYRYCIAEIGVSCTISYEHTSDISRVLNALDKVSRHDFWQVRQAAAHFLRCFQSCHKFLLSFHQTKKATKIIARLLSDERREVSSAAMSALTGILAATPLPTVYSLVEKYRKKANNSVIKSKKKLNGAEKFYGDEGDLKEKERAAKQQTSVFFLCAAVLAMPYNTPPYVPRALAALSKHSYERSAPFNVREAVKLCCSEYKRTHMSDNWEMHRQQFTREQLEALEDVVSAPHYYA